MGLEADLVAAATALTTSHGWFDCDMLLHACMIMAETSGTTAASGGSW